MIKYALVNGTLIETAQASIPIDDRGFRFGDGVFESIPVYGGLPYLWEYHMERLAGGLKALRIACNLEPLMRQALKLLSACELERGMLRIQVSRGSGSRGYLPVSPPSLPTLVMQAEGPRALPDAPVCLWLSSYEKISPKALPTRYKLAQGLGSTLARMEAQEHGCFDALQLDRDGDVSEAGSANIFWRSDGVLYTPALQSGALAGVTRRRVIELWPSAVQEGMFPLSALHEADAVILTHAGAGAIAVGTLAGTSVFTQSAELAHEINTLRNSDITQYTLRLRESLA